MFIAFVMALAIVFAVWKAFLAKQKPVPPEISEKYKEIKINLDILKEPILEKLQVYPEIKPLEGAAGRENPFSSY